MQGLPRCLAPNLCRPVPPPTAHVQAAASNGSDTDATEDSAEPPRTRQRLIPEDDDAPRTLIPQVGLGVGACVVNE